MTQSETMQTQAAPPVIDYEGSGYKTDFWVNQGRDYEDAAERLALARLMPPQGLRLAEIGAGFGRLADRYAGYEQVVLFDYSRTLLADAAASWGTDPRFVFVAGNIYELPLASNVLDTLVMVRVMHHLADVPAALAQLQRVLHARSVAVIEYANKRNLKAMARWLLGRQEWSPLTVEPVEFVALNFDFHPAWMERNFVDGGWTVQTRYGVSHFRMPQLKARFEPNQLARLDAALFAAGGKYPLAPSVFVQATAPHAGVRRSVPADQAGLAGIFRCPACGAENLTQDSEARMVCPQSGHVFARREGVWDFKEPLQ